MAVYFSPIQLSNLDTESTTLDDHQFFAFVIITVSACLTISKGETLTIITDCVLTILRYKCSIIDIEQFIHKIQQTTLSYKKVLIPSWLESLFVAEYFQFLLGVGGGGILN